MWRKQCNTDMRKISRSARLTSPPTPLLFDCSRNSYRPTTNPTLGKGLRRNEQETAHDAIALEDGEWSRAGTGPHGLPDFAARASHSRQRKHATLLP